MDKLLVVFNICGITRENPNRYLSHLLSLVNQQCYNVQPTFVVSSCCNSNECAKFLLSQAPIYYNQIIDPLPISVTFNHTVELMSKLDDYDDHMFIDSGVDMGDKDNLQTLYNLHKSSNYAMTCARTDDDMGFDDWFKTDVSGSKLFATNHLEIPVGKAVNLHAQIFHREIRDTYGKVLPDIFAGQCMESTFSFLCAALKKRWIVHKDIVLRHLTGMDGPSSGFSPAKYVRDTGNPRWDHLFHTRGSILDIIGRGIQFGMGYEENQGIVNHDPNCYAHNVCVNDDLKGYIRDNLYLKDFDYSQVRHTLYGPRD